MSWSSKSFQEQYLIAAYKACCDESAFKAIKTNQFWWPVIGSTPPIYASECLSQFNQDEEFMEVFNALTKSSPFTPFMAIKGHDTNLFRLARHAYNIKNNFKNIKTVVEFGSSIGELCDFMLNVNKDIEQYYLIDFPQVSKLAEKHLSKFPDINKRYSFEESGECDLFVSIMSMTEYSDDDLYQFSEKYISKAKNIYLVSNIPNKKREDAFIKHLNEQFHLTIERESRHQPPFNKIIFGLRDK